MRRRRVIQGISLGAAAALSGRRLRAETPGITAPEIRIGSTNALSGPASANGVMALTQAAYFRMVNEQGGIAGRQINFIFYDNAYSPPKAVEMVRRLVESDHVGFLFGTLGTPSNSAIARYCNHNKVPQLFISNGADKFADYQQYPWTVGFNPSARTEAQIYAKYVRKALAEPRVAVLYQNDDFGKDYLAGMTEGLGDGTSTLLAGIASYEVTDPTIDSQIFALQASGANVLLSAATPKAASQAIRRTAEIGWKPLHCVATTSTSVNTTLKPAGLDHATGVISAAYMKDATDPRWGKDPAMAQWREFMDR